MQLQWWSKRSIATSWSVSWRHFIVATQREWIPFPTSVPSFKEKTLTLLGVCNPLAITIQSYHLIQSFHLSTLWWVIGKTFSKSEGKSLFQVPLRIEGPNWSNTLESPQVGELIHGPLDKLDIFFLLLFSPVETGLKNVVSHLVNDDVKKHQW